MTNFLIAFFVMFQVGGQSLLPAIGMWREHLPYNSAIDVTAGNDKIYCATPFSLFSVDISSNSIERMSRVTGLAETGVSCIRYDESNQKLFIAYSNSNIDIIYRNDIFNIPDIKRENISGDKSIYNIYPRNGDYFLSTGLGVIVIDGKRYEVRDSWFIGNGGSRVKVNGFTTDANYYYAATEEGLKRTSLNTSNPANYLNWENISGSNGLPAGACQDVVNVNNNIIVLKGDSLFKLSAGVWDIFYAVPDKITSINSTAGKLSVCHLSGASVNKVVFLNPDRSIARTIQQNGVTGFPKKAIIYNNEYWIADEFNALSHFSSAPVAVEVYKPNSPDGVASGEMMEYNSVFYATAGEVNDDWNYQYNGNGIYRFKNGEWKNFNRVHYAQLDSMLDFICIDIDKRDESVWAGSFGGGLLHIRPDETFEIFKQNSPIKPPPGDPTSYRVAGLKFDAANNLWLSNFGALQPLLVRKADGNWKSFSLPYSLFENALSQIVLDEAEQLWMVSPLGNGLICYNYGASIDDLGDDHWKLYRSGGGNGNLPSNDVNCLAKDKSGFIWVGTADGIAVIQCAESVFSNGCEAVLPVVEEGNFAGYLFKGENVKSIAVDGADRKWVATRNGVWLINPDGEKVLERFTEENSPLLSNDVKKVAINNKTGEVYFATQKGICSFRAAATEGGSTHSDVVIFPNPVPPGFTGSIGIRGLAENSVVKITELDGRLVFQTRSLGGQAVWDGKDYRGRKISSGVYLVLVSNEGKTEKQAGKIIFISK